MCESALNNVNILFLWFVIPVVLTWPSSVLAIALCKTGSLQTMVCKLEVSLGSKLAFLPHPGQVSLHFLASCIFTEIPWNNFSLWLEGTVISVWCTGNSQLWLTNKGNLRSGVQYRSGERLYSYGWLPVCKLLWQEPTLLKGGWVSSYLFRMLWKRCEQQKFQDTTHALPLYFMKHLLLLAKVGTPPQNYNIQKGMLNSTETL